MAVIVARAVVVADGAAGRRAEQGVVAREVSGDAADDRAANAAARFGGSGSAGAGKGERQYQCDGLHFSLPGLSAPRASLRMTQHGYGATGQQPHLGRMVPPPSRPADETSPIPADASVEAARRQALYAASRREWAERVGRPYQADIDPRPPPGEVDAEPEG